MLKEKETLRYENSFSLIIVAVKIKGHSYGFIFDTGANATIVSIEVANAIGLIEKSSIVVKDAHAISQKLTVGFIDK